MNQGKHALLDVTPNAVDKLNYAGNLKSLISISESDRYAFEHVDVSTDVPCNSDHQSPRCRTI